MQAERNLLEQRTSVPGLEIPLLETIVFGPFDGSVRHLLNAHFIPRGELPNVVYI